MAKSWEEKADLARACLEKARRRMKKRVDEKRGLREFDVGEQAMVKLLPQQFKAFLSMHNGHVWKYEGPFPMIAKVGKVSYCLELPSSLKIHPVFHVRMFKPHCEDKEDSSQGGSLRALPIMTKSFEEEIEEVLDKQVKRRRGVPPRTQYLIKWKGVPESEST
ncbi:PREDICTED: uncharacterized protein LOC105953598 [Erythranthe guttata]|uniref:uncharacterized protein LOC105953598 n=1 Tax=Erythranthe guttata TaxID=4155 RepID=UPI00064DA27D|nr:PREDICTED: uncharacterized protein LOC105953598 [Erythranthe guttata]|eukprot:XP_012832724.1 PREDICTED: uncharacterized protein LOC105953598 [Erythranthe guttata]